MTEDEAKRLLPLYADGLLEPAQNHEVETLLASTPSLQSEFTALKEENALLAEALAPLNPSRSARMRLSDAMIEVHKRAQNVANTLPEKSWRIFTWVFTALAVATAVGFTVNFPRINGGDENVALRYTTNGLFLMGLVLILGGRPLARLECMLMSRVAGREMKPSRLEILMIEVFGMVSILASIALYAYSYSG